MRACRSLFNFSKLVKYEGTSPLRLLNTNELLATLKVLKLPEVQQNGTGTEHSRSCSDSFLDKSPEIWDETFLVLGCSGGFLVLLVILGIVWEFRQRKSQIREQG